MSRSERGFTLLEVMVALAIFAVMAGAIALANTQNLSAARQIEEQADARWVNQNVLAELRLSALPDPGTLSRSVTFNQRDWDVELVVSPVEAELLGPYLRHVELSARLATDADGSPPLDRLIAILGAP